MKARPVKMSFSQPETVSFSSLLARSAEQLLKLQCEFFIASETAIVHGEDFANAANRQLGRAGQTEHKIIRIEMLQFSDGMNSEEHEGFFCLQVVLENNIKRSIDRDSGSTANGTMARASTGWAPIASSPT